MIQELQINDPNYQNKTKDTPQNRLNELSKINIFVGANNSGKSRFMRSLFTTSLEYIDDSAGVTAIKGNIAEIKKSLKENPYHNQYTSKIIPINTNQLEIDVTNNHNNRLEKAAKKKATELESIDYKNNLFSTPPHPQSKTHFFEKVNKLKENYSALVEQGTLKSKNFKIVYIPMLRGLRNPVNDEHNDLFAQRTIKDYFQAPELKTEKDNTISHKGSYPFEIFTGLNLYKDLQSMLLGSLTERNLARSFEEFLANTFFHEEVELIPRLNSDVVFVKIGKKEERPIYDLGDGLQTIIITTFPLFKYQNEDLLLFIEEPEITLHPGLQRKLMNAFCEENQGAGSSQIFFTTHSNHLLDITLDLDDSVSIYSFEAANEKGFSLKNIGPNKDVLDLLGVRNSSVFLSNSVIWVEGISDRLFLQYLLELYSSENEERTNFEEDKHYSILEYAGGNITHFNFEESDEANETINIEAISKNNFIIADNDGIEYTKEILDDDKEKTRRIKLYHEKLGESFFAEHREIENLIPKKVYQKYFENLSSKRNWKYNPEKTATNDFHEDIKTKPIGEVLRDHFLDWDKGVEPSQENQKKHTFYKNDISCLGKPKKDLAMAFIKIMKEKKLSLSDFPEAAGNMVEKAYAFIEKNNTPK